MSFCVGMRIERRWRVGVAYRRAQHNVFDSSELCDPEIAWRRGGWWRRQHEESKGMDY